MKYADYITKIEIDSLWSGKKHIVWSLDRRVNILSGVNGVGKSTILNKVVTPLRQKLAPGGVLAALAENGVHLDFFPADSDIIRFDVIRSFDRPLINSEMATKLDFQIATELDLQLFNLQRRYLDYQVNLGNRMIAALQEGNADEAQKLSNVKVHFHNVLDELYAETGKKVIRSANEIRFSQVGEELTAYQLSSGEKQMLVILLTVLVEDSQPYVLFMDEPEVSLHVDWQEQLIDLIMDLNPNVQIILTTHSPAMILNGWIDRVTEVSEIEIDNKEVKKLRN